MRKGIALAGALALLCVTAPLAAQTHVQATPFYGYIMPQGELPQTFALDKIDGTSVDIADGEFESRTAFFGATAGLRVYKGLSVEVTVLKGTDKLTALRLPETDVDILAYSAGLALALPKQGRFAPYLLAGIGVKTYDFDIPGTRTEEDGEYNFGAGVNVEVTKNFAFNLQARDLMSNFSSSLDGVASKRQNDLLLAAGFTFTFGFGGSSAVAIQH